MIFEWHSRLFAGDWVLSVSILLATLALVSFTGSTYGTYVKQIAEPHVTIWSKHEEFPNAGIIMWFSHHVAFYTGKKVIVLPTADIAQVELLLPN
jgi:hypothetical protein